MSLLISTGAVAATAWDLNDVTYIFPLPNTSIISGSIRASDLDASGQPVIPVETLTAVAGGSGPLGLLMEGDVLPRSANFDEYNDLFLLSLRIDPCFKDNFADQCRRQIRAVWQPVDHWRDNSPESIDAAVHTFYDLSEKEFSTVLEGIQTLKSHYQLATEGKPLGINPGFSNITLTEYQKDFRTLILQSISLKKMSRMAILKLAGFGVGWDLFSKNIVGGALIPVKIFPKGDTEQQVSNIHGVDSLKDGNFDSSTPSKIAAEIISRHFYTSKDQAFFDDESPVTNEQGDQLLDVMLDSKTVLSVPAKAQLVLAKAQRIEDPKANLPGTVDCVSCHVSNAMKVLSGASFPAVSAPQTTGKYNLTNNSFYYANTHQLRMLGYLYDKVQIADRSIYEAAAVADYLNSGAH